jgi:nitrate/TMAO reductase-like tetraheme cytochrome c subunit
VEQEFKARTKAQTKQDELESAHKEWNKARTAFYQAQANFENADGVLYIDMACRDMDIAEARMDNALRKLKALQEEQAVTA